MTEELYVPGKTKRSKYFGFLKFGKGAPAKANLNMSKCVWRLCKKEYTFDNRCIYIVTGIGDSQILEM